MNQTTNLRRIMRESEQLKTLCDEYKQMFNIKMVDDNIYHWESVIFGPKNTPYDGYEFVVDIMLPRDYPKTPLSAKFITSIQHVNINTAGDICLDILNASWSPKLNITSVLISIISLLSDPNFDDPLNSDLAGLYRKDKKAYRNIIRTACRKSAKKHI